MEGSSVENYKYFVSRFLNIDLQHYSLEDEKSIYSQNRVLAEKLFKQLNEEEILGLNKMFSNVYFSAVYQTLEKLDEEISSGNLVLKYKGIELPIEPFGEEICSDWASIFEGGKWPDEQVCPVHTDTKLKMEAVPIRYGLPRYPKEYFTIKEQYFPLSNEFVLGGCLKGSEEYVNQAYCIKCREALDTWSKSLKNEGNA